MTTDWHGYEIISDQPPVSIHIGHLPGRKQVCLYVSSGSIVRTLAFFRNEDDAREALALLDQLAHSTVSEQKSCSDASHPR